MGFFDLIKNAANAFGNKAKSAFNTVGKGINSAASWTKQAAIDVYSEAKGAVKIQ